MTPTPALIRSCMIKKSTDRSYNTSSRIFVLAQFKVLSSPLSVGPPPVLFVGTNFNYIGRPVRLLTREMLSICLLLKIW